MKYYPITPNKSFIGRQRELKRLADIHAREESVVIVVYGRRRVGKTELIEQFFQKDKILKFEGLQPDFKNKKAAREERQVQIKECLLRLSIYFENPKLAKLALESWTEFFELLDPIVKTQKLVVYFEEIQWLSNYASDFLASLKPFWDDSWRHNKNLRLVLCGSSPSFIMGEILSDKALYGRSLEQFHLQPFHLIEIRDFLGGDKIGLREVMLATLTVGGIPEYLKKFKQKGSVYQNLCKNSFLKDSVFSCEKDKIFVSSLSHSRNYENIINLLSQTKQASRQKIAKSLGLKAGGYLTVFLNDLESCGFIQKYTPLYLKEESKLTRFCMADKFLQFYYSFIAPVQKDIAKGKYTQDPTRAISRQKLNIILGFSFERWCRENDHILARVMKFDQIEYQSGAFYNYKTIAVDKEFQIDLMYIRADTRIVICEIKYLLEQTPAQVAQKLAQKVNFFKDTLPKYKNYTIETALITTEGTNNSDLYDHVVTFDDLFKREYWD